jgi:indolepyruvate decarboxylase
VLSSCITHPGPVYLEFPRDLVDAPCEPIRVLPPAVISADAVGD